MKEELVKIIKDLVAFQTIADNHTAIDQCFSYIKQKLSNYPFVIKEYEHNGVKSVVWLTQNTLTPEILLNAHIDVVPASAEMFNLKKEDDKIIGRGVSDMKFAIASFLVTIDEIYKQKSKLTSLGIMITSDEERGGVDGTGYLVNEIGYRPKVVVIPDGGDNWKLVEEAKGVLHLKVISWGKTAHASRQWEGENAIDKLAKGIVKMREIFPELKNEEWKTTVNVGKIIGGNASNQVCSEAELSLDVRLVPDENKEEVKSKLQTCWPQSEIQELIYASPFKIDRNDKYIQNWADLLKTVNKKELFVKEHGASDGRFFSEKNIPVILSKPIGGGIHSEKEWLDLTSLEQFIQLLLKFLLVS